MSDLIPVSGEVLPAYEQLSLFELAEEANREHRLAIESGQAFMNHVLRCGQALIEAKTRVRHGEWLPWLAGNFHASEATGQRYMQVASNPARVRDFDEPTLRKVLGIGAHVGQATGESEWYTPAEYIETAVHVMGAIDLDPASNATANEIVGAARYYDSSDDGLAQDWEGRVWMNPPYAQPLINHFCAKLADSYGNGVSEAIALVNNATETAWFQGLAQKASAFCFPAGRVRFWNPERESAPLQGQAIIYLGTNIAQFLDEFAKFGFAAR